MADIKAVETQATVTDAANKIMSLMDAPLPEEKDAALPEGDVEQEAEMESQGEEEREDPTSESEDEPTEDAEPVTSLRELSDNYNVEEDALLALTVEAKINGEVKNPTIKDLIDTYQRGEDVGTKYRDLANERKQFETEAENAKTKLQEEWGRIQALNSELESLVIGIAPEELNRLKEQDPDQYNLRMSERQMRMQQVEQARGKLMEEQARRVNETYTNTVQAEKKKLMYELPEWQDEKVATQEQAALRQFLLDNGFKDWEIDGKVDNGMVTHTGIIDHRAIMLARKAMLFDQTKKAAEPKKKKMPKLPKVGSGRKQTKEDAKVRQIEEVRGRVRKSGTVKDAALAIRQMMEN